MFARMVFSCTDDFITDILHRTAAICGQRAGELLRVNDLGQALESLYQARAGSTDQVGVDAVDLAHLQRGDSTPVGALVDSGDVAAVSGVFRQDDVLWIGADDRFIRD